MYALEVRYENTRCNKDGRFSIRPRLGQIPKWTVLPSGSPSRETLQLLAIACAGAPLARRLGHHLRCLQGDRKKPTRVEFTMVVHGDWDLRNKTSHCACNAMTIRPGCRDVRYHTSDSDRRKLASGLPVRRIPLVQGNRAYFSMAWGRYFNHHHGSDDFEFTDPYHRLKRLRSLFVPLARLTDPSAFVERLRHKGTRCRRFPALQMIQVLSHLLKKHLSIDPVGWFEPGRPARELWLTLPGWKQRALVPVFDLARHLLDATPFVGRPYERPMVVFVDRPDVFCSSGLLGPWLRLMDCLLPNAQFVITLGQKAMEHVPTTLRRHRLAVPAGTEPSEKRPRCIIRVRQARKIDALLVDVDKGRLPNLALMKLSAHLKSKGKKVELIRGLPSGERAEDVYASCVFSFPASLRRIDMLRDNCSGALHIGGSGLDLDSRLPREIESHCADYDLYPEQGDRAMGFLTRGCPHRCRFCVVPRKEGAPRLVADLPQLLQGRRKLVVLDDNLLAHPDASRLLAQMAALDIEVNFNQTLDLRYIDRERADLLRQIRCTNAKFSRLVYHFSLNNAHRLDMVRRKHAMLGFTRKDNVEFICMYGYNTTLAEDVERFRFLRSLPGAYVFVQRYRPFPGSPQPRTDHFFSNGNVDGLIDELIEILFPQNMKSMEVYYRWVSRLYAETYGRLHQRLVDTIFRYNMREKKGRYIATLAGTRP